MTSVLAGFGVKFYILKFWKRGPIRPFFTPFLAKFGLFLEFEFQKFDVKILPNLPSKFFKKWQNSAKKDAKFLNFDNKILPNLTPKVLPNSEKKFIRVNSLRFWIFLFKSLRMQYFNNFLSEYSTLAASLSGIKAFWCKGPFLFDILLRSARALYLWFLLSFFYNCIGLSQSMGFEKNIYT